MIWLFTDKRMYECAHELVNMGVERVVMWQAVRRQSWRPVMYEDGSYIVAGITEFLKSVCNDSRLPI